MEKMRKEVNELKDMVEAAKNRRSRTGVINRPATARPGTSIGEGESSAKETAQRKVHPVSKIKGFANVKSVVGSMISQGTAAKPADKSSMIEK